MKIPVLLLWSSLFSCGYTGLTPFPRTPWIKTYKIFGEIWWKFWSCKICIHVLIHGVLGKGASPAYPQENKLDQGRRTGTFAFCFSLLTTWGFCAIHIFTKVCEDLTLAGFYSWCEKDSQRGVWYKPISHQEKPSSSPSPPKWLCAYSCNILHFRRCAEKHISLSLV